MTKLYTEFKYDRRLKATENLERLVGFIKDSDPGFNFIKSSDSEYIVTYSKSFRYPYMQFNLSVTYKRYSVMFTLKLIAPKTEHDYYFDEIRIPTYRLYDEKHRSDLSILLYDGAVAAGEIWM